MSRTLAERLWFNDKNQLARADDADGVSRLFLYDGIGDLQYAIVDMNQDYVIDLSGSAMPILIAEPMNASIAAFPKLETSC